MKSKRTVIVIAVVVVVIAVLAFMFSGGGGHPVMVSKVKKGRVATYVEDRAKTTLPHTYRITMPMEGRVLPITLKEGDPVKKGQVVARLEAKDLGTRLTVAQARVDEIQGEIALNKDNNIEQTMLVELGHWMKAMDDTVSAAKALVTASAARVKFSDWELKATRKAKRGGAVSGERWMAAQRDHTEATVELAKDQFVTSAVSAMRLAMDLGPKYISQWLNRKVLQRTVLEQKLIAARAELDKAKRDLDRAAVTSSVDGVVLKRHVQNLRALASGHALLDIGRLEEMQVTADILSQDAGGIRPGLAVDIYGSAVGADSLAGKVLRIKPQGVTKLSSLGVEQQRVAVVIGFKPGEPAKLAKAGRNLGVAYRVRVRIYTAVAKDTLFIPRTALFRSGGLGEARANGWRVFVIQNGKAVMRKVSVGLMNDYRVQVLEGLKQGEEVVNSPSKSLRQGDEVSPVS